MPRPAFDTSTINLDILKKLKVYEIPSSYRLQADPGNGCFLDAPGYPTYFTRSVYTKAGNTPPYVDGRVHQVIVVGGVAYATARYGTPEGAEDKLLHKLWKPLPIDHPRVRAWMIQVYKHMNHCYQDVERPEYGRPGTLIFPVPAYKLKTPRTFKVTPGASQAEMDKLKEAMDAELAAVNAHNEAERLRAERIATPENHQAVVCIRKFYPEHQPDMALIANPDKFERGGDWWERYAEQPSPEDCPGIHGHPHDRYEYCQLCGRTTPKVPAEV